MKSTEIALMQKNWRKIVRQQADFGARFYQRLFLLAPETRAMFHDDIARQANMLVQALDLLIMSLDKPEAWQPLAGAFAVRHATYGVRPAHYGLVGQALLLTLEEALQADYTPDEKQAWSEAYTALSGYMIGVAYPG